MVRLTTSQHKLPFCVGPKQTIGKSPLLVTQAALDDFFLFAFSFCVGCMKTTYPKLPFVVGDFSSCCVVTSD